MASSNRHWPRMFKSKPSSSHHQRQVDINSTEDSSVQENEERTPEAKPRWNPKPEQIRILEAIFNSGMVNPPREEIRKITIQLQEYGQVGDANIFYWFQNRKSRSKHKLRHLQNSNNQVTPSRSLVSSSSSSEKSPTKGSIKSFTTSPSNIVTDASYSPTGSVNQGLFQAQGEFLQEPRFPFQPTYATSCFTQGLCFNDMSNLVHQIPEVTNGQCTSLLPSVVINPEQQLENCCPTDHNGFPSINQGLEQLGIDQIGSAPRLMVYINDVAMEMAMAPINVRLAFGDNAMLLHSSGQPVLTDEFGVTLQPLQHGASYHLISLKQFLWGSPINNVEEHPSM